MLSTLASTMAYSPNPIPSSGSLDLSAIGDMWQYAASFLLDTIKIIASEPLLIAFISVGLIGVGVTLFKRLINV